MEHVNVGEAKAQLSKLLERAEAGEESLLARAGRPVARLVQYAPRQADRVPGVWQNKVWVAPDFDDTPEAVIDAFDAGSHDFADDVSA